jgi:nitrogen fixation NifU-like protein
MYSKKVLKHFMNPHNMGEIKHPDGVGEAGNPVCGDILRIYIKVEKNRQGKPFIKDIKFQSLGCAAAIATSSMVTDLAKGKMIEEALKISNKDVADALEGLPPVKMHCSLLAEEALRNAINDYMKRKKD